MKVIYVGGVDPGLVHTGVVGIALNPYLKQITVKHQVVLGAKAEAVKDWFDHQLLNPDHIFIEGYRPRANFSTDTRMVVAVQQMKAALPGSVVLNNTGVKKVVRRPLMELLNVWKFDTPTHHDDLKSAARIALLGMLKDPAMNKLLSDVVRDHLHGETWDVEH